jgi:hypothetical protein
MTADVEDEEDAVPNLDPPSQGKFQTGMHRRKMIKGA